MPEQQLKKLLQPHLPGVSIYCTDPGSHADQVIMLAAVKLWPGLAATLPNLQLIQKVGAGVDGIVRDPELQEHVRITRLKPDAPAQEIAEYCVAYVLYEQRNMRSHEASAANAKWEPIAPRQSPLTTVGVLGLGHIGGRTARCFAALGFRVIGWSRSVKSIDGVDCRSGSGALPALLGECDYVASILPSTPDTRNLFNADLLSNMKPGSVLINAGRGDLIDEQELIDALDNEKLAGAVLDVFRTEPLPPSHPFWGHEKITITPHVSGWHLDDGLIDIAENYKRLRAGEPLVNEVNRAAGY